MLADRGIMLEHLVAVANGKAKIVSASDGPRGPGLYLLAGRRAELIVPPKELTCGLACSFGLAASKVLGCHSQASCATQAALLFVPGGGACRASMRGARFVADRSGQIRIFVRGRGSAFEVSVHAAKRITQRGLTLDKVEGLIQHATPFRYFHGGRWKTGYFDPQTRVFVGTVDGIVTTVIDNAKPNYIKNLRSARP